MKRKINLFAFCVCILAITLTACSPSAVSEEDAKAAISTYSGESGGFFSTHIEVVPDGETFQVAEVIKRTTDKKNRIDDIWCKVQTTDEIARYDRYYVMHYRLYDKGGWILDNVSIDENTSWNCVPLKGADDDFLENSLGLKNITFENGEDKWKISSETMKKFSVTDREPDLESKSEKVVVSVQIEDGLQYAIGEIVLFCKFAPSMLGIPSWFINSTEISSQFIVSDSPENKLEITNGELISQSGKLRLPQNSFNFNTLDIGYINDFEILAQKSYEKNTTQVFECKFLLVYPTVTFEANAIYMYYFNNEEWQLHEYNSNILDLIVVSTNIIGEWIGTMQDFRSVKLYYNINPCILRIESVDVDGTVSATFSYTSAASKTNGQVASFKMIGKLIHETLRLSLEGVEWIESRISNEMEDMFLFENQQLYYGNGTFDIMTTHPTRISNNARIKLTLNR